MRRVKGLDNLLGLGSKVVVDTLQNLHVGLDAIQLGRDDLDAVRQLASLRAERRLVPIRDCLGIHHGVFAAPLAVEVEGSGRGKRREKRRSGVNIAFIIVSVVCSALQDVEDGYGRHDEQCDEGCVER